MNSAIHPQLRDPGQPACVAASLAVRSRALGTLEEHRTRMRRSAELVERSRALCAGPTAELFLPGAPPRARPHLRLVPREEAPTGAASCMRFGCTRPATFVPRVVISFGARRLSIRGMPLRVCDVHARDLDRLSRTPAFLDELRTRIERRGGEPPAAMRVEFDPLH